MAEKACLSPYVCSQVAQSMMKATINPLNYGRIRSLGSTAKCYISDIHMFMNNPCRVYRKKKKEVHVYSKESEQRKFIYRYTQTIIKLINKITATSFTYSIKTV